MPPRDKGWGIRDNDRKKLRTKEKRKGQRLGRDEGLPLDREETKASRLMADYNGRRSWFALTVS